jgi:mannobiose 2-epimerase
LLDHFDDKVQGGVFWELDAQGQLVNGKKQTYAQSFAIYALCAYYKATGEQAALDKALSYFQLLEQHSWDLQQLGYLEAFSQHWQALQDLRLSDKDLNYPKTMNTHLHVLEAYTALYLQHKTVEVQQALERLTLLFAERIVNASNGHLRLFMDMDWADHSPFYSYGHDIEASWLLWEALCALDDQHLLQIYRPLVVQMADVALQQGLCADGHLADEWHLATQQQHQQSCWWIQAEALVGFLTAWRLTGDMGYFSAAEGLWDYIQREHIDAVGGEWHWLAASNPDRATQYKVGFWKGPYHSGRAMMEAALLLEPSH